MNNPDQIEATSDKRRLRTAFAVGLSFALLLWLVKLVEFVGDFDFSRFGIYPRLAEGLRGILLAPFIHGSFAHLFANTTPIIVIGTMLLYGYPRAARVLLPSIYLGGGLAVWLFAREANHIGASGIAFGMLFFVLTIGILRRERRAIALSLILFFLYGGMIWGVLPGSREISFESHLSGALIGMLLAFLLRRHDPEPARKQYSWEREDAEDDDYDWPGGL
ncbi:MAG: rhomboid family intramembrane serine protease [Gammaproteobacteria bacterium]|nr:rhomboid family intramembrane serine protease [Gammaproteobacteria bacterium]